MDLRPFAPKKDVFVYSVMIAPDDPAIVTILFAKKHTIIVNASTKTVEARFESPPPPMNLTFAFAAFNFAVLVLLETPPEGVTSYNRKQVWKVYRRDSRSKTWNLLASRRLPTSLSFAFGPLNPIMIVPIAQDVAALYLCLYDNTSFVNVFAAHGLTADKVTQKEVARRRTTSYRALFGVRRDGLLTHATTFHTPHKPERITFGLSTWNLSFKFTEWATEEVPRAMFPLVDQIGLSHPLFVLFEDVSDEDADDDLRDDYRVGDRRKMFIRRLPRISGSLPAQQRNSYAKSPYYIEEENVFDISQVYSYGPSRLVIEWTNVNKEGDPVGILLREYLLWQ
jgi:hypothetical protein